MKSISDAFSFGMGIPEPDEPIVSTAENRRIDSCAMRGTMAVLRVQSGQRLDPKGRRHGH
jgi:hypothetical protein